MKGKIIGICIGMLMIAAVVTPAAETLNKNVTKDNQIIGHQTKMQYVPGEFIVKLKKDTTFIQSSLSALNEKYQVHTIQNLFPDAKDTLLDNIYLLQVPLDTDILTMTDEYLSCPDVLYAEPNNYGYLCGIPNDANFSSQWHLHNTGQQILTNWTGNNYSGIPDADIDAPEAWDIETGSPDVIIAIVDTGIDYTHPDLAPNIWSNSDEIPGNGIDDDNNHYIDDIRGWYFWANNSNVTDGHGHGTFCAGIAGAVGNNGLWGSGVAWNCKIMPVRAFNEYGGSTLAMASMAIRYAADNGADIISMSFGWDTPQNILRDVTNYAYDKGVFLCAAAGNSDSESPIYPAGFDNVTAVAMTNQNDTRCSPEDWNATGWGSNYGEWVDIAAPGNIIYSTMPTYHVLFNDYGFIQNFDWGCGTSYASPMVAGVAALLLSKDPSLSPDSVKALLCNNVDPYTSTEYIGTGRLNAEKALRGLQFIESVQLKGGLGVKMIITNNGTSDLTNVTWQIHVDGGLYLMINTTKSGTIDIPAGKSITVSTGPFLGLGSIHISAYINDVEKKATGTQILIFTMVKK